MTNVSKSPTVLTLIERKRSVVYIKQTVCAAHIGKDFLGVSIFFISFSIPTKVLPLTPPPASPYLPPTLPTPHPLLQTVKGSHGESTKSGILN